MGETIREVISFLKNEDIIDYVYTLFKEKPELLIVAVAVVYIMVLSLWTMLERLRKRGAVALVPVYRFAKLFSGVGLNSWLSVLFLIPGVNFVMRAVFYTHVARKFHRSYFLVPFLVLLPIVFLPIVAFGDGRCNHTRLKKIKEKKTDGDSSGEKSLPAGEDKGVAESKMQQTASVAQKPVPLSPYKTPTVIPPKVPLGPVTKARQEVAPAFLSKEPVKEKKSFSITVDGGDEVEEIRVLTMAELKRERAQVKEAQKGHEIIINDYTASEPEPKQTNKLKEELVRKAPKTKSEEYKKLLRQQQLAKEANRRSTMDIMTRRKTHTTPRKGSGGIEIKIS